MVHEKEFIHHPQKKYLYHHTLAHLDQGLWCLWLSNINKASMPLYSYPKLHISVGVCWHHFLTHVKEGDSCEGKVADLEETKRCTELKSANGIRPMDQRNMLWRCRFARSGARPMESCRWSQGRRRGFRFYEDLDDSVIVFKVVYL